jgi:transposase-like protein
VAARSQRLQQQWDVYWRERNSNMLEAAECREHVGHHFDFQRNIGSLYLVASFSPERQIGLRRRRPYFSAIKRDTQGGTLPQPRINPKVIAAVEKDLTGTSTLQDIADKHGIATGTVWKIRRQAGLPKRSAEPKRTPLAEQPEPQTHDTVRRLLRKGPKSVAELADELDCSPRRASELLKEMKARGGLLFATPDGRFDLHDPIAIPTGTGEARGSDGAWTHTFGVLSDNHLCNRNSRLDVLNAAYDHYEREGITTVYNGGNWIDGEARFNKSELIVAPGMDSQLNYMIDVYPQKKGITTHFIAGDDHEGWYQQREGVEIGRYLQLKAEDAGRTDLKYLGYAEADVALKYGTGQAIMRVLHPGGGSAYATSYSVQKIVESYQGGEKPQILLASHYHKFEYGYPREVHGVQTACTTDQSLFMRKNKIAAHVGFLVIKIKQRKDGTVERFGVEFFPFYDKGYHQRFK